MNIVVDKSHFRFLLKVIRHMPLFVKYYGTSGRCSVVYKPQHNKTVKLLLGMLIGVSWFPMNSQSMNSMVWESTKTTTPSAMLLSKWKHCQLVPWHFQCLHQKSEDLCTPIQMPLLKPYLKTALLQELNYES